MSYLVRRLILICIAAGALAAVLWLEWPQQSSYLAAQDSSIPAGSPTLTPTVTPTETPTPTPTLGSPTPTATRSRRTVNEIVHPQPGDAVANFAALFGTAVIRSFRKYDVHIAAAGSENWRWLHTSQRVVRDGELVRFDSSDYPDGFYDLRVRAIDDQGNYNESFLRGLEIRNHMPPTETPVVDEQGNLQTMTPTLTATATPIPPPTYESFVPGGRGIFSPLTGDRVNGYVPIIATVNGYRQNPYDRFELALSPAGLENWDWLHGGESQHWQSQIYLLDTRQLADGLYDLRLRNVLRDGNYEEYFARRLLVANRTGAGEILPVPVNGFTSPRSNSTVGGVVEFRGTAAAPNFLRWELYFSPAGQEQWAFVVSSDQPVLNGTLAQLDLTPLGLEAYDFRLRVVYSDFNYDDHAIRQIRLSAPTPTPPPTSTPTATSTPAG